MNFLKMGAMMRIFQAFSRAQERLAGSIVHQGRLHLRSEQERGPGHQSSSSLQKRVPDLLLGALEQDGVAPLALLPHPLTLSTQY